MASVKLKVPVLAQETPMCCWHTSALMVWQYWQNQPNGRMGPMNTLSPVYDDDTNGLSPQAFITLAQTVGLVAVPTKNTYTCADIRSRLTKYGPLWAAGYWYGEAHIVVITGADNAKVYLNDPDEGQKRSGTIAWFNEKLASSLSCCLMAKDSERY